MKNVARFFVALMLLSLGTEARAQETLPVVKMVNGAPIDPGSADTYYNALYANANTHTSGLCGLNSVMCNLARPTPIVELARSLSQGGALSQGQFTQNVFEYVYKNIDTEFRYGLSKGAFGALLDQSGTPFDQAHLMVELLRQGGVTASYQAGTIALTPAQFQAWTGLINAQAACQYLANGGIPAIVNGSSGVCSSLSGNVTSISIAHIWVSANGTLYDPSFKIYIQKVGIDLAAAMGCGSASAPVCASQALSVGIPTSSQGYDSTAQANYIQNVQYAALGNTLNGFATNLQHYIQTNAPTASVQDIVGGQQIDPASAPTAGGLPYTVVSAAHSWAGDIPDQYRSRINVQFNGINTWLFADETYGYWLYVAGSAPSNSSALTATLYFERERGTAAPVTPGLTINGFYTSASGNNTNEVVPLAMATFAGASNTGVAKLLVDHPYAAANGSYMDDIFTRNLFLVDFSTTGGSAFYGVMNPFLIVQSWGRMGPGAVARAAKSASGKYPDYGVDIYRDAEGSALPNQQALLTTITAPTTVATWLSQAGSAVATIDGFSGTRSQEQHSIGLALEGLDHHAPTGITMDVWSDLSVTSMQSVSGSAVPAFAAEVSAYNALEGSAIEQDQDTPDGGSAVRWFEMTNEQGNKFYQANSTNISSVLASTTNFGNIPNLNVQMATAILGNQKEFVASYAQNTTPPFNIIVPQNGRVGIWANSGTTLTYNAAPALAYSTDGSQIGYVTTDATKGAQSGLNPSDPAGATLATVQNVKPQKPLTYSVSPNDGSLKVSTVPDIVTGAGEFPNGLDYIRYYDSNDVRPPECGISAVPLTGGIYNFVSCGNGGFVGPTRRYYNGWRDNFEVEADFTNDGARALGADTGLDASSAIAALYTIRNLAQAPSFANYLGQAFVAAWMTDQIGTNAVVLHKPPATETFIRLPDGTFNPRPGETGLIVQTSARVRYLSPSGWMFKYQGIGLTQVDKGGAQISFKSYIPSDTLGYNPGSQFEPVTWTFPIGLVITFNYTNPFPEHLGPDTMIGVSNNLGHSFTFSADPNVSSDPDGYTYNGWIVADENGRTVNIRNAKSGDVCCAMNFVPASYSVPASVKVVRPDGQQWRINFSVGGTTSLFDAADTRLSSIASPDNLTSPYINFTWDGLYRTKTATDANSHTTTYFPAKVSTEQAARSYMVDAIGNVTTSLIDRFGHPILAADPLGRVTATAYDDIGRLLLEANPQLDCKVHVLDIRGNEISTSQYPAGSCAIGDPGNGQLLSLSSSAAGPLTSSATYGQSPDSPTSLTCSNPVTCNLPMTQTDPKGNVTNYTWNATTGQVTQILKPADASGNRPESDLTYTSLNGISFLTGKQDKIASGVSTTTSYGYNASNKYVLQSSVVDSGGLSLRTCYSFDAMGNLISKTAPKAGLAVCP